MLSWHPLRVDAATPWLCGGVSEWWSVNQGCVFVCVQSGHASGLPHARSVSSIASAPPPPPTHTHTPHVPCELQRLICSQGCGDGRPIPGSQSPRPPSGSPGGVEAGVRQANFQDLLPRSRSPFLGKSSQRGGRMGPHIHFRRRLRPRLPLL